MENPKEKKQNNRRADEKRNPDSKHNTPSKEKEWDPNHDDKDDGLKDKEKLKALKDVRNLKSDGKEENHDN